MNAPLFIARRLSLRRGEGNGERRSPAVAIATVGIGLSVAVMMLTLAIVPGFKNEVTRKVMNFDAQISIMPLQPLTLDAETSPTPATLTPELADAIRRELPPEANLYLAVRLPGILKTPDQFTGVVFEAFSHESQALDFLAPDIIAGTLPDYGVDSTRFQIVISAATARTLSLSQGDRIDAYFFTNDKLRARPLTVAAIYDSHFNDFDRLRAYMALPTAQTLAELAPTEGTAIQIRGLDNAAVTTATDRLSSILSDAFHSDITPQYLEAVSAYQSNPLYFSWLELLDTNVAVIIVLMACVGAVTLISCLFIMILERVNLIGTIKALGATNSQVRRVFIYMAERVVLRGIVLGDIIALAIIALQRNFNLIPLDPESYYLSAVPVEYNWLGFLTLNLSAAVLAVGVMLLPVMTASRISPAKVMRFE